MNDQQLLGYVKQVAMTVALKWLGTDAEKWEAFKDEWNHQHPGTPMPDRESALNAIANCAG